MTFAQTTEKFESFTRYVITNKRGSWIEIIPEMGARLNRFSVTTVGGDTEVIDGYVSIDELVTEYYSKGSFLAPFPNRVADGRYVFEGEEYQLPINKPDEHNAIHGFISDKNFSVIRSGEYGTGYELVLEYTSHEIEGFPYSFRTVVAYIFGHDDVLTVKTEIKNLSTKNMPLGFGWHPYFMTGAKVNDLTLRIPPVEKLGTDGRLIPTGVTDHTDFWTSAQKIGDTDFDTGFQLPSEDKDIVLLDEEKRLTITVSCGEGYDYVQIFIPPWRTSIAIEPMTCAADAFNNKMGLKIIGPGEICQAEFKILVARGA